MNLQLQRCAKNPSATVFWYNTFFLWFLNWSKQAFCKCYWYFISKGWKENFMNHGKDMVKEHIFRLLFPYLVMHKGVRLMHSELYSTSNRMLALFCHNDWLFCPSWIIASSCSDLSKLRSRGWQANAVWSTVWDSILNPHFILQFHEMLPFHHENLSPGICLHDCK